GLAQHIIDANDISTGGVVTIPYNFQDVYGTDTSGNLLHNLIRTNPAQEQLVREIFGLFSYYTGLNFVETASAGITVAVGDVHAVSPAAPPTAINGAEGPSSTSNGAPVAVINGNVNWGTNEYGGSFFRVAMDEIGHALGLGTNYDQPGSIMGPAGYEDASLSTPTADTTQVFPGTADVNNLQFLYPSDSSAVDLYKFTVTQTGTLDAQTYSQRLTPTSQLNTLLSLYDEQTLLGVPQAGGQVTNASNQSLEGQTFSISSTTPAGTSVTSTFEFNSGYSLHLLAVGSSLDGDTFSLQEGNAPAVTFEFAVNGRTLSAGDTNVPIDFNSTDPLNVLAGDVVQAINFALKTNRDLASGMPPISATYSGNGVINIGGDTGTVVNVTGMSGAMSVSGNPALTNPTHVIVRYAPSDSQQQLAAAIASAINSPVLDVLGTPTGANQNGQEQFTVSNGVVSHTFELDTTGQASAPGIIPVQFNAGDSPATIAQDIANAVNAAFAIASAENSRVVLG
ncbi:MAG: hypothetical protein ACREHD_21895, partial [Pirellulales bacterium]